MGGVFIVIIIGENVKPASGMGDEVDVV
jgi:hypothetical protein